MIPQVHNMEKGFTMLESILAIGLAIAFLAGSVSLVIIANQGSSEALQRQRAVWAAQEGLAALSTIAWDDLVATETGDLTFAANEWSLSTNGPEELENGLSRNVKVQAVERDVDCDVSEGGSTDIDSYFLESSVGWTDNLGKAQTVTFRSLRTDWGLPMGDCFAPASEYVTVNTAGANWHGGKQLRDIFVSNSHTEKEFEIDKITFTWDNPNLIEQVFVDSDKFWARNGPGTPAGRQPSGTLLDGEDEDIEDEETFKIHKVQFTEDMTGTTITIKIDFTDGSSITTDPFIPG